MHGADVVEELGEGVQLVAFECEQVEGPLVGLAVGAHVGDGVEPVARGRIERPEVGDVESGEEVLLHVTDAGLERPFSCPAPTLHGAMSKR